VSVFTGIAEVKGSFTNFIIRVEASGSDATFLKVKAWGVTCSSSWALQISGQAQ